LGGSLTAAGAGSDIWGTADSFHFVYESIHDTTMSTDIPTQDGTNAFAKAGLMIRQSLDPGSPHVILDVKPNGDLDFMTRQTQGGSTTFIAGFTNATGRLSLVRSHGTVTAYLCPLGGFGSSAPCSAIGSTRFPSGGALAGAAVTSHDPSTLNHATFGLSVFELPAPWNSHDVGPVGLPGSAVVDNDTFMVIGAGADIWGTSDAFHFAELQMQGDGEALARVTSENAANTFAKAGVIMTGGPSNNTTVILDIRPNGVIEFMARPANGAAMQFLAGSAASLPVWLKLERRGNQFTGEMSTDGSNWQVVGMTTVSMSGG
jgi:hypothetical protein